MTMCLTTSRHKRLVQSFLMFCLLATTAASTAFTSDSIVFYRRVGGGNDICIQTIGDDSSRVLIDDAQCPAVSPDGTTIAFQRDLGSNKEIFLAEIDGSNQRRLTNSNATERQAAWSPDGTRIAIQSDRDGNPEIYIIELASGEWTRITNHEAGDMNPVFSPDGTRLLFCSMRDGNWELYLIDLDSGDLRRLTSTPLWEVFPKWSPDGTRIVFKVAQPGVFQADLHVMNIDGSNEHAITSADGVEEGADWSPDGSRISFQSMLSGKFAIYVIDPSGGEWQKVTTDTVHAYWPSWVPQQE